MVSRRGNEVWQRIWRGMRSKGKIEENIEDFWVVVAGNV